jgi:hypothetical protein
MSVVWCECDTHILYRERVLYAIRTHPRLTRCAAKLFCFYYAVVVAVVAVVVAVVAVVAVVVFVVVVVVVVVASPPTSPSTSPPGAATNSCNRRG